MPQHVKLVECNYILHAVLLGEKSLSTFQVNENPLHFDLSHTFDSETIITENLGWKDESTISQMYFGNRVVSPNHPF